MGNKIIELSHNYISLIFCKDIYDIGINVNNELDKEWCVGENYSLSLEACDGVENESTVYKLIGVVDNYKKYPINALIVKQIKGEQRRMFSLTRVQCHDLGVEFEEGLQLLPKTLPWKHYPKQFEEIIYNENDFSTFPMKNLMYVEIKGFSMPQRDIVETPYCYKVKREIFVSALKCINLLDGSFAKIKNVDLEVANQLFDKNGTMHLVIVPTWTDETLKKLKNRSFKDIFQFYLDIPTKETLPFIEKPFEGLVRCDTYSGRCEVFQNNKWNSIDIGEENRKQFKPIFINHS